MPTNVQCAGALNRRLGGSKRGVKRIEKKSQGKGVAKAKKRPEWDWSSKDLSAHKSSKEELERRHQSHQSKNLELAKHELYDKAKMSSDLVDRSSNVRPSPLSSGSRRSESRRMAESRRLFTLQRALHDRELHHVLARSDESMRVVRDLFGDDPKRYTCQPNVTMAPSLKQKMTAELNSRDQVQHLSQHQQRGPGGMGTTHSALDSPGGIWDDSMREMMAQRKPALNDSTLIQGRGEGEGVASPASPRGAEKSARVADLSSIDGVAEVPSGEYKPQVDLRRFQQLLEEEESRHGGPNFPPNFPSGGGLMGGLPTKLSSVASNDTPLCPRGPEEVVGNRHVVAGGVPARGGKGQLVEREKRGGSAWCDDSADSLHNVVERHRAGAGRGHVESMMGASELSCIPLDHIRSREDATSLSSQVSHLQPSNPIPRSRPLVLEERRLPGDRRDGRGQLNPGRTKEEEEEEGTLMSTNTSKIHADLSRLEQLVRDLDQKLEVSKKFFPRDGSPQLLQKQHGTTSDPGTATTSDPGNTMTSELRTGTTSDPRTVAQANMSSLLMSVRRQLEQSEKQLAGEVMLRGQFLQTLADQQDLIDTIAADLLKVQRVNMVLRKDMAEIKTSNMEEIAKLKSEVANLGSALFLLLQQPPPPPPPPPPSTPAAATSHSLGRLRDLRSMSSPMTKEIVAQLSLDLAPSTSAIHASQVVSQKTTTVATSEPDSGVKPSFSQSWVELTPRVDLDASLSRRAKKSLALTTADKLNPNPGFVSSKACDGVVYAQVSPLSYSENSAFGKGSSTILTDTNVLGKGLTAMSSRSSPSLIMKPNMSKSDYFLSSSSAPDIGGVVPPRSLIGHRTRGQADQSPTGHPPAPPPISVAVLPPPMQEPDGSHSTPLLKTSGEPSLVMSDDIPIHRSKGHDNLLGAWAENPAVPTRAELHGHSIRLGSEDDRQGVANELSLTSLSDRTPSSVSGQDLMASQAGYFASRVTTTERLGLTRLTGGRFDVAGLLKSLQQLEEGAQRTLVAGEKEPFETAAATGQDRSVVHAQSMNPGVRSSQSDQLHLHSLTTINAERHYAPKPPIESSSAALPTAGTTAAVRGLEGNKDSFKALTPITEESTLTTSLVEDDVEGHGDGGTVVSEPAAGAHEAPALDGERNRWPKKEAVPYISSPELYKGTPAATDRLKALQPPQAVGMEGSRGTGGFLQQRDQATGRPVPSAAHSKMGGVASTRTTPPHVQPSGAVVNPPSSSATGIRPPPGGVAGVRPRGDTGRKEKGDPDTWFSLTSHLAQ